MIKNRKKLLRIVALLVLSISILALVGCGSKDTGPIIALGESYTTDQFKITLNSYTPVRTISSLLGKLPAKQEKVFVLLNISFENTSEATGLVGFENFFVELHTAREGVYGISEGALEILDDFFPFGYVEPGKTMKGTFPFEIPNTSEDLVFVMYFDGQKYSWTVDKGEIDL